MKFVLAMNAFKGSLKSIEACKIIKKCIEDKDKNAIVLSAPIADGGDGPWIAYYKIKSIKKNPLKP